MANDNWCTPDHIFKPLDEIFNFDCDLAASHENAKCRWYFTKEDSAVSARDGGGLKQWGQMNWCNPPYSRGSVLPFVAHTTLHLINQKRRTVMLIKADPSTEWFKLTWGLGGHYWYYKRIKFEGADAGAKFPNALVFFGDLSESEIQALGDLDQGYYTKD